MRRCDTGRPHHGDAVVDSADEEPIHKQAENPGAIAIRRTAVIGPRFIPNAVILDHGVHLHEDVLLGSEVDAGRSARAGDGEPGIPAALPQLLESCGEERRVVDVSVDASPSAVEFHLEPGVRKAFREEPIGQSVE